MTKIKRAFSEIHADPALKHQTFNNVINGSAKRKDHRRLLGYRQLILAASLIFTFALGYWAYFIPVSAISIDVNPSIEIEINRLDRVIEVYAFNEDGQQIIDNINVKNMNYIDAVIALTDTDVLDSYLQDATLEVTVSCNNGNKLNEILNNVKNCMNHENVHYGQSTYDCANEAHHNELSCGKYEKYILLKQYDKDLTTAEVANMTMKELNDLLQQYGEDVSGMQHGQGHGHHHGQ